MDLTYTLQSILNDRMTALIAHTFGKAAPAALSIPLRRKTLSSRSLINRSVISTLVRSFAVAVVLIPAPTLAVESSWHGRSAVFEGEPFCVMDTVAPDSTVIAFLANPDLLAEDVIWIQAGNPDWPYEERVPAGDATMRTLTTNFDLGPALTLDDGYFAYVDIFTMPDFVSEANDAGFALTVGSHRHGPFKVPSMDLAWGVFLECIRSEFGNEPFPVSSDPFSQ